MGPPGKGQRNSVWRTSASSGGERNVSTSAGLDDGSCDLFGGRHDRRPGLARPPASPGSARLADHARLVLLLPGDHVALQHLDGLVELGVDALGELVGMVLDEHVRRARLPSPCSRPWSCTRRCAGCGSIEPSISCTEPVPMTKPPVGWPTSLPSPSVRKALGKISASL